MRTWDWTCGTMSEEIVFCVALEANHSECVPFSGWSNYNLEQTNDVILAKKSRTHFAETTPEHVQCYRNNWSNNVHALNWVKSYDETWTQARALYNPIDQLALFRMKILCDWQDPPFDHVARTRRTYRGGKDALERIWGWLKVDRVCVGAHANVGMWQPRRCANYDESSTVHSMMWEWAKTELDKLSH